MWGVFVLSKFSQALEFKIFHLRLVIVLRPFNSTVFLNYRFVLVQNSCSDVCIYMPVLNYISKNAHLLRFIT